MDPLEFLTIQEISVKVGENSYKLVEASAEVALDYRNKLFNIIKPGIDGKPTRPEGLSELAGLESYLVSRCLFRSDGTPVPEEVIRKFPYRVQKSLFDKVQEISGMDADSQSPESLKEKIDSLQERLKRTQGLEETLGK